MDVMAELLPLRWRRADSRTLPRTGWRQRLVDNQGGAAAAPEQVDKTHPCTYPSIHGAFTPIYQQGGVGWGGGGWWWERVGRERS